MTPDPAQVQVGGATFCNVYNASPSLALFEPISLYELADSDAQLLTRKENKFLMTFEQYEVLLTHLKLSYKVLEINGTRVGRYETQYYDTESFMTYFQHHNGKAHRFKVRSRYYCSTDETYLEIKERKNTGRTVKKRLETGMKQPLTEHGPAAFLQSFFPYDFRMFRPVLTTTYNRVTLVSKDLRERVTLDLSLSFHNNYTRYSYPGVVIGEIKYNRTSSSSQAQSGLKRMRIRRARFSKYCLGVSLLYAGLKHNHFKRTLMNLEKLHQGVISAC